MLELKLSAAPHITSPVLEDKCKSEAERVTFPAKVVFPPLNATCSPSLPTNIFNTSDEVSFIKKENKGIVVHVSRYTEFEGERQMVKPDNEYELRNDKKLIELSDYSFSWPTNLSLQKKYCNNFIKWIDNNYVGV